MASSSMTHTRRVPSSATEELHKLVTSRLVLIRTFIEEPNPRMDNYRLERIRLLLRDLDEVPNDLIAYIKEHEADEYLHFILVRRRHQKDFPDDVKESAEALCRKWEAVESGVAGGTAEDEDDDERMSTTVAPTGTSSREDIRGPPTDDIIWGLNGIMHGIAIKVVTTETGTTERHVLDTRYPKRPSNPGANGLLLGSWYGYQITALHGGAHGARQDGIAGNDTDGATSIILSGKYRSIDEDNGDTILYSIPKSLENTDPVHLPISKGATLLHKSVGRDVRVLRSHTCRSRYAPFAGLRYDGLYRVVGAEPHHRRNDRGGVYTRYVLRRCPGQEPLGSIHKRSPTHRQKRDLRHAWDLPWLGRGVALS